MSTSAYIILRLKWVCIHMHIHTHESHTLKRVYTHTRSVHWCSYGPRVCVSVVECTTATTTVKMAKFQRIGKRCWYGTGLLCAVLFALIWGVFIYLFSITVFSRGARRTFLAAADYCDFVLLIFSQWDYMHPVSICWLALSCRLYVCVCVREMHLPYMRQEALTFIPIEGSRPRRCYRSKTSST